MSERPKYNPQIHHRRSIRLKGYDYSQAGAYFITLCTYQRECIFGQIENGVMELNEFGWIVQDEWEKTKELRPDVELGPAVIMPNHFHGILWIMEGRGTARRAPTSPGAPTDTYDSNATCEQWGKPIVGSIPTIVRAFKSAVTRQMNLCRNTPGAPVWQRNYYEHIIRDETAYRKIAEYIRNNPARWEIDQLFVGKSA